MWQRSLIRLQPVVYNTNTVIGTIYSVDGTPIGTTSFDSSGAVRMVSSSRHLGAARNAVPAQRRGRRRRENVSRFIDLEAEVDDDDEEEEGDEDALDGEQKARMTALC